MSVKDLFHFIPLFRFEKMFFAIKFVSVIAKNCLNLFATNLAIHKYYNKLTTIMSISFESTNLSKFIPKPNAHAYDKFVFTATKNESIYIVHVKQKD